MSGRVYLVGAGCGGPELLTLRAAELLRACSCVVYDDLIDPAILDLAPPEAELNELRERAMREQRRFEEALAGILNYGQSDMRRRPGEEA